MKPSRTERKRQRMEKVRAADRMKSTHEWVSDIDTAMLRQGKLRQDNVHCKCCGMDYWYFRFHPMTCREKTIHEVIT